MNDAHIQKIAGELKIQPRQVLATAKLFAEGATVPVFGNKLVRWLVNVVPDLQVFRAGLW